LAPFLNICIFLWLIILLNLLLIKYHFNYPRYHSEYSSHGFSFRFFFFLYFCRSSDSSSESKPVFLAIGYYLSATNPLSLFLLHFPVLRFSTHFINT
jgi:hypothetical protein